MSEPSYDLLDAIRLALLFHTGGPWDDERRAEWLRITGRTEATTLVMCDHLCAVLDFFEKTREALRQAGVIEIEVEKEP